MGKRHRIVGIAGIVGLVASVTVVSWSDMPSAAAATTIAVTTTADELNTDGDCSLREAVQAVNVAAAVDACPAGSNHLVLPVGLYSLLTPIDVTKPLTVTGAGRLDSTTDKATLIVGYDSQGVQHAQHLFQVRPGASLTVEKSSLSSIAEQITVDAGGGPLNLTSIMTGGDASPLFTTVDSPVVVTDGVFQQYSVPAGTTQSGSITIKESTAATFSSCVFCATSGSITIQHSLTSSLRTTTGPISVSRSYVRGGQYPAISSDSGAIAVDTSSISYDTAPGVRDGGGSSTVRSSTFQGSGASPGPALQITAPGTLTATNSIVRCGSPSAAVRSGGHNLTDGSCGFAGPGDIVGAANVANTVIGPARNVSMTIDTGFMPAVGSLAIDHGGDCGPVDQRGYARSVDGDRNVAVTCDIGAVEVRPATALAGDWNGDGVDTPGRVVGSTFLLATSSSKNPSFTIAKLGNGSGRPVVGDWNGDGIDTIGVVQGDVWFLSNSNSAPKADLTVKFAVGSRTPVVGDWNGDGIDTPGVVNGSSWSIRNTNTSGGPDATFTFGSATSQPVVGDWDGDGTDSPGAVDAKTWRLVDGLGSGPVTTFSYGAPGPVVVGDWDGDGRDGPGRTPSGSTTITWFLRNQLSAGVADLTFVFGALSNT